MRMFERGISDDDIREILSAGEIIDHYPDGKPYPSQLLLGWIGNSPMHILTAETDNGETIIIKAYHPEPELWEDNFEETLMKCPICKHGDMISDTASITLERNAATLVFKNVPA